MPNRGTVHAHAPSDSDVTISDCGISILEGGVKEDVADYSVVFGGVVALTATVTNTSGTTAAVTTGIRSGIGSINDEIYNTKKNVLSPGESVTVEHTHSPDSAGGYGYYMSYAVDISSVEFDVATTTV